MLAPPVFLSLAYVHAMSLLSIAACNKKKKIFLKQMLEENNTLFFLKKFIGIILFQHVLKKDFYFFVLHAVMDNKLLAWQQSMERKTGGASTMGVNFIGTPLKRRCGEMVEENAEK